MRCGPHSTARLRVIASTPAFAMADGTVNAAPVSADSVRTDSTEPARPSAIQRRPAPSVQ